ncbi:hypothetical protein COHA_008867 [Chlorella ohadii]|uniref:Protein SirB1 N-terminal domain-containing protein n=1 Tax=Chlorella ohadii TaxID=2649997 RepID=A0AAD5H170_9CHLO|nr:hypothetical protein COHA_008867 [Chlorella ohadii]
MVAGTDIDRACAAAKSQQPDLPSPDAPPGAVADWASAQFLEAARSNLTKSCLLLALEEEAAAQAAYLEAEGLGPESVAALRGSVGSASTWSLERISALAEECTVTLYAKLHDLGVVDTVLSVAKQVPDSTLLTLHTDLVRSYPTQLILAINHVLYERHGYRRQRRHGDPLDMRLSNVLENGNGSPGSLAVLYLELAARLSLPLEPVALEGGRYYVLQPADDSVVLSAAGERFVIDPYSEGMLLSETEVKELFEVEGELRPCSNEVMLAGMLGVLRDSHWCAAVGCPPEPIWAVPIAVEVALGEYRDVEVETSSGEDTEGEYFRVRFTEPDNVGQESRGQQWWPAQGYNLRRALAAAHKRSLLLPSDLNAQLEYALLLYFGKRYEEAWTELGCVLQAAKSEAAQRVAVPTFDPEEIQQMEVLWEKIRLQLAFAA